MEPDIDAESVTDALAQFDAAGYRADFSGRGGLVHCGRCNDDHGPELARVDHVFRYEGPSDPDEQAIVFALSCPVCGAKGTLVSGYGPSTDPDYIDLVLALSDDRH
jgi:hypothetical protein